MVQSLQNRISKSRLTLPVTAVYAILVWLACGFIFKGWWLQFGCFALTSLIMVLLNNANALIRVFSRLVSSSFLVLYCCICFLFPSQNEAIMMTCMAAAYMILFQCYQDKQSMGKAFYAFLCIGLASIVYVHTLFYVPFLWILMVICLHSLSWGTWFASFLGLLTPYWFASCWLFYQKDLSRLLTHFSELGAFQTPFDLSMLSTSQTATFTFMVVLSLLGTIHCLRKSYQDKIRVRMLFGFFIWMDVLAALFLLAQPQHYDSAIRIMLISTSPLIAHFLALTSTKLTNVTFLIIVAATLALTAYNLWNSSFLY